MDAREVIARAQCRLIVAHQNPDKLVQLDGDSALVPQWFAFRPSADAILAGLREAGMVVVPSEPTQAMIWAGAMSHDHPSVFMGGPSHAGKRISGRIYRAMLAASASERNR